jgi:uncharacterized delta-60 repeat protein
MRKIVTTLVITSFCVYAGRPGDLDYAFNRPTGYVATLAPNAEAGGSADVGLQSDGKIIAAGLSNFEYGAGRVIIARYNVDGTLDTSFGSNGILSHEFDDESGALSVVIQSDDKIVIGGYAESGGTHKFLVARFTKNGKELDTTFNGTGYRTTLTEFDATADNAQIFKIGLQQDEKIVATGYYYITGDEIRKIGVVRYKTDGTIDDTFGTGGVTKISEVGHGVMAANLSIFPSNDYIALSGFFEETENNWDFYIVKLKDDGTLDTTFNETGKKRTSVSSLIDAAYAVTFQSDGKIVAAGASGGTEFLSGDLTLVRYKTNGDEDTSFGANHTGIVTTKILTHSGSLALLEDSNHNLIAGGLAATSGLAAKLLLVRYTSAGAVDTTFGSRGIVLTDVPTTGELIRGMVFQPDGKIVAAGSGIATTNGSTPITMSNPLLMCECTRNPIYRDGTSVQGYFVVARYLNEATTLTPTQRLLAQRLANQWGLGPWFDTSVNFFNLMQLKGNDFGVTHIRPVTECKIICTHCS